MVAGRVSIAVVLALVGGLASASAQQPRVKAPRAPGAGSKVLGPATPAAAQPAAPVAGQPAAPAVTPAPVPGAPTGPAAVTPQSAATARPAAAGAFTAGLSVEPFAGGDAAARLEYVRTLSRNLDSATAILVALYRNTSGQPMAGANSPTSLSARERTRWTRCRDIYWDFTSYPLGLRSVRAGLPLGPALEGALQTLDSALDDLDALGECDNLASMMSAPERWDPWPQQYETAARHFYADWYRQVREAHERGRALVVALNASQPGARPIPVPPALPRNPPYAGAGVR